jgi:hypothetical protein
MNKKNWVFGVVFVMMMVLGLVTMVGCPAEDNGNNKVVDPSGGKTVEQKYWGTWKDTENFADENDRTILTIGKNSLDVKDRYGTKSYVVYTIDNVFWYFSEGSQDFFKWGTFESDTKLKSLVMSGSSDNMIFERVTD